MKFYILTFCLSIFLISSANSQDMIWLRDGNKLNCKIVNQDSSAVYFNIRIKGVMRRSYAYKNTIDSVKYNYRADLTNGRPEGVSMGFGVGLDHGGIGTNIVLYPARSFGLFGGVGYALAGTGFNAGLKIKLNGTNPKTHVFTYLLGMYGYNAAIGVTNAKEYNKLFYGPSFGFGMDIRRRWENNGYLTMALILPVRKKEVNDYFNLLERRGVEFKYGLPPVAISIGYHFILN
jgi:hypothetical protein